MSLFGDNPAESQGLLGPNTAQAKGEPTLTPLLIVEDEIERGAKDNPVVLADKSKEEEAVKGADSEPITAAPPSVEASPRYSPSSPVRNDDVFLVTVKPPHQEKEESKPKSETDPLAEKTSLYRSLSTPDLRKATASVPDVMKEADKKVDKIIRKEKEENKENRRQEVETLADEPNLGVFEADDGGIAAMSQVDGPYEDEDDPEAINSKLGGSEETDDEFSDPPDEMLLAAAKPQMSQQKQEAPQGKEDMQTIYAMEEGRHPVSAAEKQGVQTIHQEQDVEATKQKTQAKYQGKADQAGEHLTAAEKQAGFGTYQALPPPVITRDEVDIYLSENTRVRVSRE